MIQLRLLLVALAATQVLGSAIKGGLEQAPTKGGALEAPAAKGRAVVAQQQQQQQEELLQVSQVEEIRSTKGGARKQPPTEARKEAPAEKLEKFEKLEQQQQQLKLEEHQQVLEKKEESSKTRFEARPQVQLAEQLAEQQPLEQVKLVQAEQQQVKGESERDIKQEIELRAPVEEQHKLEFVPIAQSAIYQQQQQQQEEIQQQQIRVGAAEAEPYSFSYNVEGSSRSESGDSRGVVRGQYTLQGADGSRRIVDYIADQDGFRASVNTNEFGTEARSPAGVALRSSQPSAEEISLRLEGKTRRLESQADQQQQQQLPIEQFKESYAAVKGQAPAAPPALAPAKGAAPLAPLVLQEQEPIPAAVKRAEPLQQQQQEQQKSVLEEGSKSAELLVRREPKALKAPQPIKQQQQVLPSRSAFESATAHRDYRAPQRQPQPQQLQQVAALRGGYPSPTGQLLRAQPRPLPPSPAQAVGYRRQPAVVAPVEAAPRNPRVSFYAANEEEQPNGFDSRSA